MTEAETSAPADGPASPTVERTRTLRRARTAAGLLAVASVITLAVLALAARAGTAGYALATPVAEPRPAPSSSPRPTPPSVVRTGAPTSTSSAPSPPTTTTTTPPTPATAPAADPPAAGPPQPDAPATCALGLPVPAQSGGAGSLIGIVPLFGPFTAEAFALSPAWAPFLETLGPSVAAFGDATDQAAPLIDTLTPPVQQLENAGFEALLPLYGPYREQFLAAQADLATQLAPGAETIAAAPGTECLIALQAALLDPATG